jgi:hypothetical protein
LIDFLDEIELFIGEKPIFTKKKNRHSAVWRNFMAVQTKNFVQPLFERCFLVSTLKKKRNQKFVCEPTDGICRLNPKCKKKMSEHQINQQNKYFSKKTIFLVQKSKAAKNSYRGYPTEFAGSTQNVKKNCRNIKSTNQNNNFPKKNYV